MNNEEKILRLLEQVQSDISDMKKSNEARLASVDARFIDIQSRFNGMDRNIEDLQIGQRTIREDISKVNHTLEPKINAVYEALDGLLRRNEQAERHEKMLEKHDHRLFALEQAFKSR